MASQVKTQHPDYTAKLDQWQRCRDVVAGSDAVKAAGVKYLPMLKDMSTEDYNAYKLRASWFGAVWGVIRGFKGMLLRKPPQLEIAESLLPFLDDVTMDGKPIYDLLDQVVDEMMTTRRPGILVDYPQADTADMTQAQAEALNLRPRLAFYRAETIINWKRERINNAYIVSMVVLTEDAALPGNEFEHKTETHYRVLDLSANADGQRVYRQRLFRINDKKEDEQIGADIYPLMNGKLLTEIPFFIEAEVDEPPLIDLVDLNLDHYRLSADLKHGLHFGGLPTAVISGYTQENAGDKLYIGSSSAWVFPDPQARATYLEFTGQGLTPIAAEMDKTEERMAVVGARLLATEKKDSETAQTANIHRAGEASVLSNIGRSIGILLSKALTIFSEWAGVRKPVTVTMNDEFLPPTVTPQELTALVSAWQSGAISMQVLFAQLQKAELITSDLTLEEMQAQIGNTTPPKPTAPGE